MNFNQTKTVNMAQAMLIINATKGKIFGATFTKANGQVRTMSARLKVSKGVVGTAKVLNCGVSTRRMSDASHNHITVFDCNADRVNNTVKGNFRKINMKTLKSIRVKGEEFTVIGG